MSVLKVKFLISSISSLSFVLNVGGGMRCFLEAVFIFFTRKPGGCVGGGGGGVGGFSHIKTIKVCASPWGRVFVLFWFENENTFCPFWSRIGYDF